VPGVLPGRRHIVLTRDPSWTASGAEIARSVDEALQIAGDEPVSPDVVTGITVNGAPLAAGRYVVSSRQDLVGLFDSLLPGDTVAVTLDVRTARVLRAGGTVTGLGGHPGQGIAMIVENGAA